MISLKSCKSKTDIPELVKIIVTNTLADTSFYQLVKTFSLSNQETILSLCRVIAGHMKTYHVQGPAMSRRTKHVILSGFGGNPAGAPAGNVVQGSEGVHEW